MRCNPLRWLLGGVLIIGLLGIMNIQGVLAQIEAELEMRAEQALTQAGLDWVDVGFSGRDSQITGEAPDESERRRAQQITGSIWGVRKVTNRAELIEEQKNYVWRALLRDNRLKLHGYAPNEATRKAIIGAAKATFPDLEIQDRVRLARGAPDTEVWLGAVSFGLKQLSRLRSSAAVEIDNDGLAIAGEAQDFAAYRAIKSSLANSLPQGVKLKSDQVVAPRVKPYVWAARLSSTQIQLGGFLPSEQAREEVFAAAQTVFPQRVIVDRMRIASGEPDDIVAAAVGALTKLAMLEEGEVEIKAKQLQLSGVARKEETAKQLGKSLREAIPKSIDVSEKVKFLEPAIPAISPYETAAEIDGQSLRLGGYAPEEAARKALTEAAGSHFPKLTIADGLQLGTGAPEGWQTCMAAGLAALGKLGNGRMSLTDRTLRFAAVTDEEKIAESIRNELRAGVNRACELDVRLVVDVPPEPELIWRAVAADGQVLLEGEVPDEATKAALHRVAEEQFAGARIVDRTSITAAYSRKWVKVSEAGLRILARLRSGEVRLDGQSLAVTGQAADTAVATFVKQQLRELPNGYTGSDAVEVRSDAMIWAEQVAKRKAEAEARRKAEEEEARRKAEEDRLRAAEEARRAEEEARRLQEEERRKREAEAERKAEAEQARVATPASAAAEVQSQPAIEGRERTDETTSAAAEQRTARVDGGQAVAPAASPALAANQDRPAPETDHAALAAEAPQSPPAEVLAALTPAADERCEQAIAGATLHGTVNFARGSATLQTDAHTTLSRLVEVASACPHVRIEIEGHADAEGSPGRNQVLSEERAESAVDFLVGRGIPLEKINAVGYGATRPVAPNDTADSRALNRRVEIIIRDH